MVNIYEAFTIRFANFLFGNHNAFFQFTIKI